MTFLSLVKKKIKSFRNVMFSHPFFLNPLKFLKEGLIYYVLRFKFSFKKSYSQAGQDKFVRTMLQDKRNGKYIEIGAFDPILISNTYLFEKEFSWEGFSLDIKKDYVRNFNLIRKNKCLLADGTNFDYLAHIQKIWGNINRIDYLQIDCEPAEITYKCLCALPLDEVRFSVITFETDLYESGERIRKLSREKFKKYGYKLIAADVCNLNNPFEDWYVDPYFIDLSIYKKYICNFKEGRFIC